MASLNDGSELLQVIPLLLSLTKLCTHGKTHDTKAVQLAANRGAPVSVEEPGSPRPGLLGYFPECHGDAFNLARLVSSNAWSLVDRALRRSAW